MSAADFVVIWLPMIVLVAVLFWLVNRFRRSHELSAKALASNEETVRLLKEIKTLLEDRK
jgi:large-conductance mechanosensitive channel